MAPSATIHLVGKTPFPGAVKTRLAKGTSNEFAAEFAKRALCDLMERLARDFATSANLVLLFAPADSREAMVSFLLAGGLSVDALACWQLRPFLPMQDSYSKKDSLVGLGVGLACALRDAAPGEAVFVGGDVPHLPSSLLFEAIFKARQGSGFIVPAFDGGYALLGVPSADLDPITCFSNVRWSTGLALATQLSALSLAGLVKLHVSPTILADVDELEDLNTLKRTLGTESSTRTLCPRVANLILSP